MEEPNKVKPKVTKGAIDNCNTSIINAGYKSNEGDNIKVYLRIRPPSKEIQDADNDMCLEVSSSSSLKLATKPEPKQFSYDHVAGMETTQEEVFSTVGKGIIEAFVDGFNGTIFAYGQTGSGKTFTMLGPPDDSDNFSHELRGVIPRGFEYIFSLINRQQDKVGDRVEFLAKCSFLEIYNESVYDLLEPSSAGLALRENIKKGVFAEGLAERTIVSAKDAYHVLQSGWLNRRVASTSMNRESSRSHAVFTVSLESKTRAGGVANIKESKLHLVDLAGSERQKDTQTADVRLKEAGSINKSLSALGNVIMALVDVAHGKTRYIHYRDSKLTFILRDSLGGNAKTYIIANVHPSSKCFGETLSTLNFARRAKMIKNNAVVNEDVSGNVNELQAEIKKLKELLQAQSQSIGSMQKEKGVQDIPISTPSTVTLTQSSEDATQWQQMMLSAIAERENAEKEKLTLQEKIEKLEEIVTKKDKFVQSTRMILKFRTQHIAKLERKLKKELGPVDEEDEKARQIKLLKDEIKCLQTSIEHHPDVKKLSGENSELRSEIRRLKAHDPSNGSIKKEMAENHRYTIQLERQLREYMTTKSDVSNSQQDIEDCYGEAEKMKMELAQIKVKLESTQNDLQEERQNAKQATEEYDSKIEVFRNKEMDLQCDLAAAKKAKKELEHTLESFQLKTVIERTTMNSLHMQTVKTLVSPRNFSSPRKFGMPRTPSRLASNKNSSTPMVSDKKSSITNGNVNGSTNNISYKKNEKKHSSGDLEDVIPPTCMLNNDSFNDYSDSDNDQDEDAGELIEETRDDEMIYVEVLQEELGQVQKLYNVALENLNKEQNKQLPLKEKLTKLEIKVKELEETLQHERHLFSSKESELSSQLVSTKDKYKETFGNSAVLKSEVDDLRIMYSSLCNQLDAAIKQKDEAHIEAGRRYASLESKHTELQIDYYNLRGEMEQTQASNNNLMSDYEQCKEELQFANHQNAELKDMINQEKKNVREAEDALEKMESMLDLESKIPLSQENKHEESIKSMETLNVLRGQLHDLTKVSEEYEVTITRQKAELEQSRSEVAELRRLNLSDKEVVNNFMKTVEDLNVTIIEKENLVTSLQSEIQDFYKEHENLKELYDNDKKSSEKLLAAMKCEYEKLVKERKENEDKYIKLQEEIQLAHNKHIELSCTLTNDYQLRIHSLQTENMEKERILSEKSKQILMLEENLVNQNQNCEQSMISPDNYITCNENLNNWDTLNSVKIESLGKENKLTNKLKKSESDRDVLESRISMLEMELDDSESQLKEKQDILLDVECKIKKLEKEKGETEILLEKALAVKETLLAQNTNNQKEVEKLNMNLCNIQEDLHVNLEELEKTKALEQKYFEENNQLQSRLAVVEEEKTRFGKQIKQLQKRIDVLEMDKAKLVAHKNTNQRIDHLVNIKKENNTLREEVRTLTETVTKLTAKSSF